MAAALVLLAASLALFWPGFAMYDSLAQYGQALSGTYDDWHPPIMARLWSLFGAVGTAPMLALQLSLYWLGLGLIAAAVRRSGRATASWGVIGIGLWPPLLGWQAVVLKDTQMLGALLAALGLIVWWRLPARKIPPLALAAIIMLMLYATLVRANAVFAVVPLAVMLMRRPGTAAGKVALGLAGIIVVLAGLTPINQRLFAAESSGVQRTQALYDLAGLAVRTDDEATGLPRTTIAALRAKHCVRPFFWDPLGEPRRCNDDLAPLRDIAPGRLYVMLAATMMHHPIAYAAHRLAHLNSTERWLVPWHWPGAAPPLQDEPNEFALRDPGAGARAWQHLAAALVEWPIGWPVLWAVLAAAALVPALRTDSAAARLAAALLVSALSLEASFAVLSIASDLRYHLWAITATAIAVLLLGRPVWRRALVVALGVVLVTGGAARLLLPSPPQTYIGMLG
ncbi:hypothetical protein [Sphingomonas sp. GC_Shp_1]|uniref:hypothetical protein n=1 Tax=unclassified Sphingomonas TaxID=196159 RepID=UPI00226AB067